MINKVVERYFEGIFRRFLAAQKEPQKTQDLAFLKLKKNLSHKIIQNNYSEFVKSTPPTSYKDYEKDINEKMVQGSPDVKFYCLTSGTTGGPKYIPYNKAMEKLFATSNQILASISAKIVGVDLGNTYMFWGSGPVVEKTPSGTPMGFASGYMSTHQSWIVKRKVIPKRKIQEILDFDTKIAAFAHTLDKQDLTVIGGASAYLTKMIEDLCKIKKIENLSEYWPQVKLVIYGATAISGYKEKLEKYLGRKPQYQGIYASSEAPMGFEVPFLNSTLELQEGIYLLNLEHVVFSFRRSDESVVGLSELKQGEIVELLISLPNGFLNYSTTDMIKIVSLSPYLLVEPMGRKNVAINIATEKSTERHLDLAMQSFLKKVNLSLDHFFVYPSINSKQGLCYEWVLATNELIDPDTSSHYAHCLDVALKEVNGLYYSDREDDKTICFPVLKTVPTRPVQKLLAERSNQGQFKMKKIFSSKKEFEDYLLP